MKNKILFFVAGSLFAASSANAEWFLRGTHNTWGSDQMQDVGSNTMFADDVVFAADGLIKFDRFGDWSESYGVGGLNGDDIAVSAGTWDIEFYTDSKDWNITSALPTQYHFRGTANNWAEGTIMTAVAGQSNQVETCQDFTGNTDPRFKVDPNGGWGDDAFPADDVTVNGSWTRIIVNTSNNSVVSVTENLTENCGGTIVDSDGDGVADSVDQCPNTPAGTPVDAVGCPQTGGDTYHFRGTPNGWAEGTLFTQSSGDVYTLCQEFGTGDANGGPRFKVDPNGAWGSDAFPAEDVLAQQGWALITVNVATQAVDVNQAVGANCEVIEGDWFVRGTFNTWGVTAMSSTGGGNYSVTVDVTSGGSPGRFKVDDGEWGNPVPAEGEGIEIDYCARYDITFNENTQAVGQTKVMDLDESQCDQIAEFKDFRDETIYFVFTDRFDDGDPSNNTGNNPDTYDANKTNWRKYFGGDIQGLIDRLDYLQNMGVTAIWTTPMVNNTDQVETDLVQTGYHGYWGKDFFQIDEHIGDWAKFDELTAALEARGMHLVMDFAPNHSTNGFTGNEGQLFRDGVAVTQTHAVDATLPFDQQWFHHEGGIDGSQMNSCDANFENCFPVASCDGHQFCTSDWDAFPQTQIKDLYGLADLAVEKQFVEDYLYDAATNWMDHGVSAFRIDAIKHFDDEFMERFANRLNDYAISIGRDGVYIFGEWFGAGVGQQKSLDFINTTDNTELLDFSLRDAIEQAVAGEQSMEELSADISARPQAWNNREDWQTIFLDNHDARRSTVHLRGNLGMNEDFANRRIDMGIALVMTLPGVPVIYYGTEQYTANFTNGGVDPYNREMIPSFDTNKPIYSIIKNLSDLRKASPAIQRGTYAEKWMNSDILVFERQEGSDVAVVAVNRGDFASINVSNLGLANGSYTNVLGGDVVNVSGGSATLELSQNEIIVLR